MESSTNLLYRPTVPMKISPVHSSPRDRLTVHDITVLQPNPSQDPPNPPGLQPGRAIGCSGVEVAELPTLKEMQVGGPVPLPSGSRSRWMLGWGAVTKGWEPTG